MRSTYKAVEIDSINLNDTTFKISTEKSLEPLLDSLKNLDIINPPVLKAKNDHFIIICGFRRLAACRLLEKKSIHARIIDHNETDIECLKFAIADNSQNHPLNLIEQSIALSKLSLFFPDNTQKLCIEASKLGMDVNPSLIKKLVKLQTIYPELSHKVACEGVSLTIALELGKMNQADAILLSNTFESLKFTFNHQKEIIKMIKEISHRDSVPITNIFTSVLTSMEDTELNRNQKIQFILQTLKKIRFPEIVLYEEKYYTLLNAINLPSFIKLLPPKNFESTQFSLILNFSNIEEFKSAMNTLEKLKNHPDFDKIIDKQLADF